MRISQHLALVLLVLAFAMPAMAQVGENGAPSDTVGSSAECNQLRDQAKQLVGHADELVGTGGTICPCAPKPGLWVERIVYCFANAPNGLIYGVVQDIIQKVQPYYWSIVGPLILFAVALFGWKLTMGTYRSITKETFTFGLKLGAVVTFLSLFPIFHAMALDMVQALAEIAAKPFNNGSFMNICNFTTGSGDTPTLWAQWDCMFGKMVGLDAGNKGDKYVGEGLMMGMMWSVLAFVFIPGFGTGIVIAFLYTIFTLFAAAMRAVNTYMMAIIAISFLMLLAPLYVPLMLFGGTWQRFYTWTQILIGYILQPMMLIIFLGIMTVTLQYAIFVGPASLFGVWTNSSSTKADYFTNQVLEGTDNGKKVQITQSFKQKKHVFGRYDVNPETTPAKPGLSESLDYSNPENTGMFGALPATDPGVKGASTVDIGIETAHVDVEKYVEDMNSKDDAIDPNLTAPGWIERALLQLLTTGMLVYTLYAMLGKIPQITHSLVARQAGNLAQANVLGLAAAQRAIALAREAIKIYIAVKTGNKQMLAKAAKEVAQKSFDNMVSKR